MGMFDYIECEYPLPGLPDDTFIDETFQTKSFERRMDHYTLTADGRIIHHTTELVSVPEEERPYYGTPKWEEGSDLTRLCGCMKAVPTGDVYLDITDTIRFYTSAGDFNTKNFVWYEWSATFIDGKLTDIRRVYD